MPEDVLFNIAPYPLRIIEPVASSWAIEASKYTWWGRTELHIRDGEERRRHLEGLTTAIGCEIQQIDERQQELLTERAKMKRVMAVYEEYRQKMREKEEEEAKLQREVDEVRKKPVVRAALMHINTIGKSRLSIGSGPTPTPAAEPLSCPASVPSPAPISLQNQRPPLDFFSRDSSPDDIARSPPKDNQVMNNEENDKSGDLEEKL
jgi:hypothetical protein